MAETRASEQTAQLADLRRQIESQSEELASLRPQAADALRTTGALAAPRRQHGEQQVLSERLSARS